MNDISDIQSATQPESEDRTQRFFDKISYKLVLPIPIAMVFALIGIWLIVPKVVADNAEAEAVHTGQNIANQFKTIRGYYTKNVIKKVKKTGAIKPSVKHKGIDGTIPLPATFIHDVSKLLSKNDLTINLYSAFPFPNRKDRKLDDFQKQAWAFLSAKPKGVFSRRETKNGQPVVRVAIADTMAAQGCVNCHNSHGASPKTDWKLGDVRGVLEISSNITASLANGARLSNNMLIGAALIGVVLVLIVLLTVRNVVGPINRMTNAMARLSEGDQETDVPGLDRRDEIGHMAKAVGVFKENMQKARELETQQEAARQAQQRRVALIDERTHAFDETMSDALEKVTGAASQMQDSSQSMSSVAEETTELANSVASASEQASANVQTVAATTEELTSSIDEIGRQVNQSREVAAAAVGEISQANDNVMGLAKSAQNIGDVLSLITDIAEQTNLLALNATIEAARAGEAGKGFAVVASEVKELASQTAQATEEISSQISGIQSATDETVGAMDRIGRVIEELNEGAGAIAAAVEQQGSATQEIARNIKEVSEGTTEVTSSIGRVTAAARQTGESSTDVLEASSNLGTQAAALRQEVDSFLADIKTA